MSRAGRRGQYESGKCALRRRRRSRSSRTPGAVGVHRRCPFRFGANSSVWLVSGRTTRLCGQRRVDVRVAVRCARRQDGISPEHQRGRPHPSLQRESVPTYAAPERRQEVIAGKVVTAGGQAVGGAVVTLAPEHMGESFRMPIREGSPPVPDALSDQDGNFVLDDLQEGDLHPLGHGFHPRGRRAEGRRVRRRRRRAAHAGRRFGCRKRAHPPGRARDGLHRSPPCREDNLRRPPTSACAPR